MKPGIVLSTTEPETVFNVLRLGNYAHSQGDTVRKLLLRKADALSTKEKELIVIGISIAIHCEPCVLIHIEKAIAAGATKAEILEACGVAIAMGGGPAMAFVPLVLKFLEEHG